MGVSWNMCFRPYEIEVGEEMGEYRCCLLVGVEDYGKI